MLAKSPDALPPLDAVLSAVQQLPAPPPTSAAPEPAPVAIPDSATVASQYVAVGKRLKVVVAREVDVSDLVEHYRRIQINDALATEVSARGGGDSR